MNIKKGRAIIDIESDPFGESASIVAHKTMQLMGGRFQFESASRQLMRLVDHAYRGVPPHRFSRKSPSFPVPLMLTPTPPRPAEKNSARRPRYEPPPLSLLHG